MSDPPNFPNSATRLWERDFKSMYANARSRHEGLLQISEELERILGEQLCAVQKDWSSRVFVLMSLVLVGIVFMSFLIFGLLYRSLHYFSVQIDEAVSNWRFWATYPEVLGAFGMCAFVAIMCAIVPFSWEKKPPPKTPFFYVDNGNPALRLYRAVLAYCLVPVVLIAFAVTLRHPTWLSYVFLSIWLGLPIAAICALAIGRAAVRVIRHRVDLTEHWGKPSITNL
jgi:hypothetical protein